MDSGPDSLVLVGGDVKVRHLFTTGAMVVGNIVAEGLVYGFYNDQTLHCSDIRAHAVVEDDHEFETATITAVHHVKRDEMARGSSRLAKFLKPELLRDRERLIGFLDKGGDPFLPVVAPSKKQPRRK